MVNTISARDHDNILAILFLFTAAVVCYSSVLGGGFIWDDQFIVLQNSLLRAPLLSFQIFKQDIVNSGFTYTPYYRPLQILSYALDYRMWGLKPQAFHLVNILFHALNGAMVFIFARRISMEKAAAFLAALFFVIDPAHMGSVAYISGRSDLLFFFFGILFMLLEIRFLEEKKNYLLALSLTALILALLSKESAAIFVFLFLLLDMIVLSRGRRFNVLLHVPQFMAVIAYMFFHHVISGGKYGVLARPVLRIGDITGFFRMAGDFLVMTVLPSGLHMRHAIGTSGRFLPAAMVLTGMIVFLTVYLKGIRRILIFSFAFFLVAVTPFFFVAESFKVYAEHWMYLGSLGVFLFLSAVIVRLYEKKGAVWKTALLMLIFCSITYYVSMSKEQSSYWLSDLSLSDRVLAFSGEDEAAAYYKAGSLFAGGSRTLSLDAVKDISGSPRKYYLRGRFNLSAGRRGEAEQDFNRALDLKEDYDNAYLGLALVSFLRKDDARGIEYLEKAVSITPRHPEVLRLLCTAYAKSGKNEKALEVARMAGKADPYGYDSLVNLGTAYAHRGYIQESVKCYLRAARLYPEEPLASYNLGYIFFAGGQKEESEKWVRQALAADPKYAPAIELLRRMKTGE
ncbi:MAG: tetratricopeptide repeat protein [Candidatus Omnitrophota bacterium]